MVQNTLKCEDKNKYYLGCLKVHGRVENATKSWRWISNTWNFLEDGELKALWHK